MDKVFLNLTIEQYNFLMSMTGTLCGFLLCLFIFIILSRI